MPSAAPSTGVWHTSASELFCGKLTVLTINLNKVLEILKRMRLNVQFDLGHRAFYRISQGMPFSAETDQKR